MSDGEDQAKRPRTRDTGDATRQDKPTRTSAPRIGEEPNFGPRYKVLGVIGKGGMGEVFRALDTTLHVEVALKVVRADIDGDGALARFHREVALARKVTSPNVLRVYDLGEHRGLHFLSMEYVAGEDLASLLRREKRLPLERALVIFRQVCNGLAAAHAQGVVHRDLKPHNVLLDSQERVKVADFGLARSIAESGLTVSGAILGSPAYMSPEQITGDPVDERSDIYSLGVMLYQLITGETPFKGTTPHSVMEMRLHKVAPPIRDLVPDAPGYLGVVAARCLERDPANRFATVAAVLAALDGDARHTPRSPPRTSRSRTALALVVAVCVALAVGLVLWKVTSGVSDRAPVAAAPPVVSDGSVAAPASGMTSVLVLGIENRTYDPVLDKTVDAILLYALRRSRRIDAFAGVNLRSLASDFGENIELDERLGKRVSDRTGDRVITVRGAVVSKGAGFSIELVARDLADKQVFAGQRESTNLAGIVTAVGEIASDLRSELGDPVPQADRGRTGMSPHLEADHDYALGLEMALGGNMEGAIGAFRRAVTSDPQFALAYADLAIESWNAGMPAESQQYFSQALKHFDQMSERDQMRTTAVYHLTARPDLDRAIDAFRAMLAIWPTDFNAEINVSIALLARGDAKAALEAGERAVKHHFNNVIARGNLPLLALAAGQLDRAVLEGRKVLAEFARPWDGVHSHIAIALALSGRRDEALASVAQLEKLDPSAGATLHADFAMAEGRVKEAVTILEKGIAADRVAHNERGRELKHVILAEAYLRLGNKPKARAAAAQVHDIAAFRFSAALVQLAAGDDKRALATAAAFRDDVAPHVRTMGKLIEAESLRLNGKPERAFGLLDEARRALDLPISHLLAARAAVDAGLAADAHLELQHCVTRRGEVAINADEVPSLRDATRLQFEVASVQRKLANPAAAASYRAFLAMTHEPDPADPLVVEARQHAQ